MKILKKTQLVFVIAIIGLISITLTSCQKDDPLPLTATINVSALNNAAGDINGNGGTATKTYTFNNTNTTVGWDMSITATSGSFQLILKDASGFTVLDKILTAGSGPQSAGGTTPVGTSGIWTATITLTNFNGTGDYSFR